MRGFGQKHYCGQENPGAGHCPGDPTASWWGLGGQAPEKLFIFFKYLCCFYPHGATWVRVLPAGSRLSLAAVLKKIWLRALPGRSSSMLVGVGGQAPEYFYHFKNITVAF